MTTLNLHPKHHFIMRLSGSVLLLVAIAGIWSGCKPKDNDPAPHGYWILDGQTIVATSTSSSMTERYNFVASRNESMFDFSPSTVIFSFPAKPTTSGEILVGSDSSSMQIESIEVSDGGKEIRRYNPASSGVKAAVSFKEGKLILDVPQLVLSNGLGSSQQSFSAHVVEQ